MRTASAPEEQIGLGDHLDEGMVRGRESQDSPRSWLGDTETGGGLGFFFFGKDDELSKGLDEFEGSIEDAGNGFFLLVFIHSLSCCLLSTYYVPGVRSWVHLPGAFLPTGFLLPFRTSQEGTVLQKPVRVAPHFTSGSGNTELWRDRGLGTIVKRWISARGPLWTASFVKWV